MRHVRVGVIVLAVAAPAVVALAAVAATRSTDGASGEHPTPATNGVATATPAAPTPPASTPRASTPRVGATTRRATLDPSDTPTAFATATVPGGSTAPLPPYAAHPSGPDSG